MSSDDMESAPPSRPDAGANLPDLVREALSRLRFGSIALTIHEGRLVQVDVTEKTRLTT